MRAVTATDQRQPVTLEGLRPGVAVIVAAGADPVRPSRPYRLRVVSVHDLGEGSVAIGGRLETLDGQPSGRRFGYRDARVALEGLEYVKDGSEEGR